MSKNYGDMTAVNFEKLHNHNPTLLGSYSVKGQEIKLYEHPIKGDETFVIASCEKHKVAWDTGFFDTDDLLEDGGDYQQHFDAEHQTIVSTFED